MKYTEKAWYLSKPLIKNVAYTINDKQIKIVNNTTTFVDVYNKKINEELLTNALKNLSDLKKLAKDNNIKIKGCNKISLYLKANFDAYKAAIAEYNKIYGELKEIALDVQERGIHMGYTDDVALDKLFECRNKLFEFTLHSIIPIYHGKVNDIGTMFREINIGIKCGMKMEKCEL
jgi:hypothetical protein